jgi:hypothetical protein
MQITRNVYFLILGSDSVDEDGQSALQRVQIIRGDTFGRQSIYQQTTKVLKLKQHSRVNKNPS